MHRTRFTLGPVILSGMALLGASVLTTAPAEASSGDAARSRSSQVSRSSAAPQRTPGHSGRAVVTRSHRASSHRVSGHSGHRGHRGGVYYRHRPALGLSFGLGYWGGYYSPYFWGYGHYPYAPYYGSRPYPVRVYSQPVGAFDLNVKPKKTQVWVDGRYIGTAGKFDGYPDYLWLSAGEHQLVFHLEGYRTVERRVETLSGVVADLRLDMERGESTPPQEVAVEPAYEYGTTVPLKAVETPAAEAEPAGEEAAESVEPSSDESDP